MLRGDSFPRNRIKEKAKIRITTQRTSLLAGRCATLTPLFTELLPYAVSTREIGT